MELVVVNGANNLAKSVIRGLTSGGKYNRVKLIDFRPYKDGVYAFQRELSSKGIQLDKRMSSNVGSLEVCMEGADKVVYFTHDYFSMTSCKNNTLVATSQIAKKLGISNLVAVCPVEHDMAASEDSQTWIEKRQEAE
jgi:methylthioribose-1-phosphate isomerase